MTGLYKCRENLLFEQNIPMAFCKLDCWLSFSNILKNSWSWFQVSHMLVLLQADVIPKLAEHGKSS
jgi:hypothetical protein